MGYNDDAEYLLIKIGYLWMYGKVLRMLILIGCWVNAVKNSRPCILGAGRGCSRATAPECGIRSFIVEVPEVLVTPTLLKCNF